MATNTTTNVADWLYLDTNAPVFPQRFIARLAWGNKIGQWRVETPTPHP